MSCYIILRVALTSCYARKMPHINIFCMRSFENEIPIRNYPQRTPEKNVKSFIKENITFWRLKGNFSRIIVLKA